MSDQLQRTGKLAAGMFHHAEMGGGGVMSIVDPRSFRDGGPEWHMRYGSAASVMDISLSVAGLIESYDYLLSGHITTGEAIRRLRILRKSRALLTRIQEGKA